MESQDSIKAKITSTIPVLHYICNKVFIDSVLDIQFDSILLIFATQSSDYMYMFVQFLNVLYQIIVHKTNEDNLET